MSYICFTCSEMMAYLSFSDELHTTHDNLGSRYFYFDQHLKKKFTNTDILINLYASCIFFPLKNISSSKTHFAFITYLASTLWNPSAFIMKFTYYIVIIVIFHMLASPFTACTNNMLFPILFDNWKNKFRLIFIEIKIIL